MLEALAKLKDLLPKMTTLHWLVLSALCGGLLFGPHEYHRILGIDDLIQQGRPYLAVAFLGSLVPALVGIVRRIGASIETAFFHRRGRAKLRNLTTDEKLLLLLYLAGDSKTNYFDPMDGVVAGLQLAGILYQASSVGNVQEGFAYNIRDWAWTYLKRREHLLTNGVPRDQDDQIPIYQGARVVPRRLSERARRRGY